jgi:hypothetical protein
MKTGFSTFRTILVGSVAIALSACAGGGQQQVTPPSGGVVSSKSLPRDTASVASATIVAANPNVAYSSIPSPLKAVASLGFEAYQGVEFGDGVNLTHTGRLTKVRYVLSSWGCQSGHWNTHDCSSPNPNAKFGVPFTLNVYAADNSKPSGVGNLIRSMTSTFTIPFRPSSNPARCPNGETFFSSVDNACVHGLANVIEFDFFSTGPLLPSQIIVSLQYNTTHYGPQPIGESAPCYTSSGGCGYDSLNISADGPGGPVGSPIDPDGIWDSFTNAADYCVPSAGLGFRHDTAPGCWTTNHPQFEVDVATQQVRTNV